MALAALDIVDIAQEHKEHRLKNIPERPERIAALKKGLEKIEARLHTPRIFDERPITEVHDPELVAFLKEAQHMVKPGQQLLPDAFPLINADRVPENFIGKIGFFTFDTSAPITCHAWQTAKRTVDGALTGAHLLMEGSSLVYVLCRPPGHHAQRRMIGGFCYLNGGAVAADQLSKKGRVAFVDVDFHHGNGTQDIFYRRDDVLFVSIHGHPKESYPFFSGYEDELGEKEGLGFNMNYPLRRGTADNAYLEVLDRALVDVKAFDPQWLVVSLGFDTMKGDPTATFNLTSRGLKQIGKRLGKIGVPTLLIQEGGYLLRNLQHGLPNFLYGIRSTLG